MKIEQIFKDAQNVYIDTAPFIYYVENHPVYAEKMDAIFDFIEHLGYKISTSVITLTEVLMKPILVDDSTLVTAYREMLVATGMVALCEVNIAIADKASYLRAKYNLRTPDAIHIATAVHHGCDLFITNDQGIRRVQEINVIIIDDIEETT